MFVSLVSLWCSSVGYIFLWLLIVFSLWFLFGLPVLVVFVVVVCFLSLVSLWSSGVGFFVVVLFLIPLVSLWSSGVGFVVVVLFYSLGFSLVFRCWLFLWLLSVFVPLVSLWSSGVGYVVVVDCFFPFGFSLVFRCGLCCGCCLFVFPWVPHLTGRGC